MPEYLRWLADYRLVVYGGLLIVCMLFFPGGLMDVLRRGGRAFAGFRAAGRNPAETAQPAKAAP